MLGSCSMVPNSLMRATAPGLGGLVQSRRCGTDTLIQRNSGAIGLEHTGMRPVGVFHASGRNPARGDLPPHRETVDLPGTPFGRRGQEAVQLSSGVGLSGVEAGHCWSRPVGCRQSGYVNIAVGRYSTFRYAPRSRLKRVIIGERDWICGSKKWPCTFLRHATLRSLHSRSRPSRR